jgi:hypothetical protein
MTFSKQEIHIYVIEVIICEANNRNKTVKYLLFSHVRFTRLIWKLSFFFHYLLVVNFFSSMINRVGCTMFSIRSRTIKWYLLNLRLTHNTMEVWAQICWIAIGIMYLVWSTDCCITTNEQYFRNMFIMRVEVAFNEMIMMSALY